MLTLIGRAPAVAAPMVMPDPAERPLRVILGRAAFEMRDVPPAEATVILFAMLTDVGVEAMTMPTPCVRPFRVKAGAAADATSVCVPPALVRVTPVAGLLLEMITAPAPVERPMPPPAERPFRVCG